MRNDQLQHLSLSQNNIYHISKYIFIDELRRLINQYSLSYLKRFIYDPDFYLEPSDI